MASNTPNLNLLKKNPATDGNDLFDINTMLNDNWDKIDTAYAAMVDTSDVQSTDISDLKTRLNTAASSTLTLQPGMQTITANRDKPYNLNFVRGRMLLNLIGRTGNFETLIGWATTGMNTSFNTSSALYSNYCLLITLTAATARISRTVPTTVGKTYLIAVDARMGTATNARVDVTGIGSSGNAVTSAAGYQLSYMAFTATATSHNVGVTVTGTNGQTAYIDGYRVYEINSTDFSNVSSLTPASASSYYPYTEGLAGVKNPYAIRWSDSARTQLVGLLAFDTELLASPTASSDLDREILSVGTDGQYYKSNIWARKQLNGSLSWTISASLTGFKEVKVVGFETYSPSAVFPIKFDGTVMQNALSNKADVASFDSSGNFYLTAAIADTGWGDNYTPTNDEIKAYFYGWVMYDGSQPANNPNNTVYNGSGTKAWARRSDGVSRTFTDPTATLPTTQATAFTPYELMYRRASTYNVAVASEGTLSLIQGDNYIEVNAGAVIREPIKPQPSSTFYWINGNTPTSSTLRNKTVKFLQVYRNNRPDPWAFLGFSTDADKLTYGLQQAQISADKFSADDVYSVTYIPMQYYPTTGFTGNTSDNERAILNDLVHDVDYLTRRVSAAELRKVDQGTLSWTAPTTLNGWAANLGFGYRIEGNRVYLRGILSNGATAAQTLLFTIPARYRTQRSFTASFGTYTAAQGQAVAIDFFTDGRVQLVTTSALAQISFEGFSYPID